MLKLHEETLKPIPASDLRGQFDRLEEVLGQERLRLLHAGRDRRG